MEKPEKSEKPICEGFHWIGQPLQHCDECGHPAWMHDGLTMMKEDVGPFDCYDENVWVVKPWSDGVIATWLANGLINRERAVKLLTK